MSKETGKLAQRAKQLYEEENWNELIPVATEWIDLEQEPERQAQAYNDRGFAYARKGDYDHAIADFDKAIALAPRDAMAYSGRGLVYAEKGDYDRAIADCDKAVRLAPRDAIAYRRRGMIYAKKGDYDCAIADFDKAIALAPRDALAYSRRGDAYYEKGDYARAIADFDKAVELAPRDALAYSGRGMFYVQTGDYARAIADLGKAIKRDPRDAMAYRWRGMAYAEKGNYARAIADCDKAIELVPRDVMAYSWRVRSYIEKGDYARAIADCDKAIKWDPCDAMAYRWRVFVYARKGDYDCAIADLNKIIKFTPQDAMAYRWRGIAYARKGDYDQSFDDLNKAVKLDPALPFRIPETYIADQIKTIFKTEDKTKYEAFKFYFRLSQAIKVLQKKLFYAKKTGVAHYTSFHTIKHLGQKGRFRLYNAAYMNDPEEGRIFSEIMKEDHKVDVRKFYPDNENLSHLSPAYIGSFVQLDSSERDKLFLWRTYGKHEAKEAAGCCLIYRQMCFAKSYQPQIGAMQQQQLQYDSLSTAQTVKSKKPESSRDTKPCLYKIIYRNTKDHKKLSQELKKLAECLNNIKDFIEGIEHKEDNKNILELARALLDSIRFLFKGSHYSEEKEARVCSIRYYKAGGTQESDEIKVDTEQIPPRFYLDTPEAFQFSKVILGPGAQNIPEWERWFKEQFKKDVEVRHSQIPYGTRSS